MDAIYVRQSVDKKDSISIDSQIDFCLRDANSQSYKIYSDRGYSGSNTNRPAYEEMIQDIVSGAINKVIVYKLDRISRSLLDFSKFYDTCNQKNVEFISYSEKFDTSTPVGRAMISVIMVFAQLERETIQKRVTDNYYLRGERGFYLGGRAPYGYRKIETRIEEKKTYTLEPIQEQALIVNEVYNQYVNEHKSLGEIVIYLNNRNLKTNLNNYWSSVSLSRLLRNPVYVKATPDVYMYLTDKGTQVNNDIEMFLGEKACFLYGERKRNTKSRFTDLSTSYATLALHDGIVESDIWLKCQFLLDHNKQLRSTKKGTHSWLSGLMKCGYCGYAITVVNGYKDVLYINCSGRKMKICYDRKRVIYVKDIERHVESLLFEKIRSLKFHDNVEQKNNSVEINRLKVKETKVKQNINRLVGSISHNAETDKYLHEKIKELDETMKEIETKLLFLSMSDNKVKDFEYVYAIPDNWRSYDIEKKQKIAKELIEKVIVTDDAIEVLFLI